MVDKEILKSAIKEYLIRLIEKGIHEVEVTEFNIDIQNLIDEIDGWIPIEERVPDDNRYILMSFENFSVPQTGRYEQDEDGGAFFVGDEDVPLASYGIYVNAWMELPECYRESEEEQI